MSEELDKPDHLSEECVAMIDRNIKERSSELKSLLFKIHTKEETDLLHKRISFVYFKRGCERLKLLNFVAAMYDFTLSLQHHPASLCFYERGRLFAKLGFLEQALADYESSYECVQSPTDKELLGKAIAVFKEAIKNEATNYQIVTAFKD